MNFYLIFSFIAMFSIFILMLYGMNKINNRDKAFEDNMNKLYQNKK